MDNRVKNVLIDLAREWKEFAHATCLSVHIVEYIDLDDKSDELKLVSFLEELIKSNPSNYMILIEKALTVIGKLDILNEIKLLCLTGNTPVKATVKRSIIDCQETNNRLHNVTDTNGELSHGSSLNHEDTNQKVRKILIEQVSSDWMRFAHIICLNGLYNNVEEIQSWNNNNQLKLEMFLQRITEINRLSYNEVIANCLCTLKRFDILLYVALDEKFAKVKKFLIEHLSTDWKRFAHETHLIDIETIVERIDQDNKDDKSKMASFLEKLFEIDPLQYKNMIGNSLCTLGKFDILFSVALDENDETVQRILVENVSADWKRLACYTCLHDIDSVVEQIDHGYSNDESKMAAFLDKLYELDPSNYKELIVNSLNVACRFDVLFRLALVESSEIVMKALLERASSDWKRFATYACLYQVNCIIENIDREHNSDQMKMTALLEKLYDINPLQFKEVIKSALITMKRFCVLAAFKEDGCHGKEKDEKENVKEETNEEPVFLNGSMRNTPVEILDEQIIADTQESNNALYNVSDPNISPESCLVHEDKPLEAEVDSESDKTVVSIPADHKLSELTPSSPSNTGPLRNAFLYDYLPADVDEEKVLVLKDQEKMNDILDNSELLLQLKNKIGKDWMNLGRFLLVNANELDVIHAENNDSEEKAYRMLCSWKNQQKFPTLNALASAIYKINRTDLIRIMEKFSNKSFETENPLKPSIDVKTEMRETLKQFYQMTSGKMNQLEHNVLSPNNVELLNKFVELTVVDANDVERDAINIAERELFLRKQMTYKPIEFYEVFSKDLPLLLISGIAGIGKTWLLKKCLLDWASGVLWENVDLVLYLECRKLNQYQNIDNINELLNVFYKDMFKEWDVCKHFSILFVIDGLDEFAYLDELINHNPLSSSNHSIVNALADALDFQKHKCVVAGRIEAILRYKGKMTECRDMLTIQIMGFNDNGINEYVERVGDEKEAIKNVLKSSHIAKAMASVPFYLSAMCTVISSSILSDSCSFFTMTELYCCIFMYFLQKHVNRNNEPVYKMMEKEINKQYVLKVCKVAWHLLKQGKVVFSQKEIKAIVNDIDKVEIDHLGFIEKVESHLGYQYQFVHLTLMEFCASIHAHIYLSPKEILSNKKLRSCLPMICGLKNNNEESFLKFLANLKTSKQESNSMLGKMGFARLFTSNKRRNSLLYAVLDKDEDEKMFMECLFEAQGSITEDMKRSISKRWWWIYIDDRKTAHEVSHEKYFMNKFVDAGLKLNYLHVDKNILSEDEKKLLILCLTNVRRVYLFHPVKIYGWTPKHKIEEVVINISDTFVSKNEFEDFVLPWIRFAEELHLDLHDNTNFIEDIYKWLRGLNFTRLRIKYLGKFFHNIEEFKF